MNRTLCEFFAEGFSIFIDAFYPIIFKYLYTVGLLRSHTLASSLTFIRPARYAG